MSEAPLLSVRNVSLGVQRKGRPTTVIVDDISFDVAEGERFGIVGESGSGKSLTLRAIANLLPAGVKVLVRHVGPNVLSQAIIYAMSDIVQDIMAIVTLGYLGLGIAPPTAEWGSMISDGQQFITTHWEQATIPGLAVVVTSLGLSWLGDGLSDLLSPDRRK